jgi:hypothetical protein
MKLIRKIPINKTPEILTAMMAMNIVSLSLSLWVLIKENEK